MLAEYIYHGRNSNLIKFEILPAESPSGVSTKLSQLSTSGISLFNKSLPKYFTTNISQYFIIFFKYKKNFVYKSLQTAHCGSYLYASYSSCGNVHTSKFMSWSLLYHTPCFSANIHFRSLVLKLTFSHKTIFF